jgi:hypothetical protein
MIKQSKEYLGSDKTSDIPVTPMSFSLFFDKLYEELKGMAKTAEFIEKYNFVQLPSTNTKRDRDGNRKQDPT